MSRVIQFPEIKKNGLRAVQYGAQDVVVYDDAVDHRQAIWNENTLEDAQAFIEAVIPYLTAYTAHELDTSPETREALNLAEATLIPLYREPAKKIAAARCN